MGCSGRGLAGSELCCPLYALPIGRTEHGLGSPRVKLVMGSPGRLLVWIWYSLAVASDVYGLDYRLFGLAKVCLKSSGVGMFSVLNGLV